MRGEKGTFGEENDFCSSGERWGEERKRDEKRKREEREIERDSYKAKEASLHLQKEACKCWEISGFSPLLYFIAYTQQKIH